MNKEIIYKYISGNATLKEKKRVFNWIKESEEHYNEFVLLRKLYDIEAWNPNINSPKRKRVNLSFMVKSARELLKVAAIFLLAFVCFNLINLESREESFQCLNTPAGQRAELTLEDGTQVWLNACSKLEYPTSFNSKERRIKIIGEAYFKVTKNLDKPFIVQMDEYEVKVTGTEFNVKCFPKEDYYETSLVEGSVDFLIKDRELKMIPGMQVSVNQDKIYYSKIYSNDKFMWREGMIYFNRADKAEVIEKLNRYFDIKIELRSDVLDKIDLSGKFRISDGIDHILNTLQLNYDFTYVRNNDLNEIIIK